MLSLDSRRCITPGGANMGKKRSTRRTGGLIGLRQSLTSFLSPDADECSSRAASVSQLHHLRSTLWVHTRATAAAVWGLDSRISKRTPSAKASVTLPHPKTRPQQTQTLPHLMSCSPVPCRDLLPHLDCSSGIKSQVSGPKGTGSRKSLRKADHFPKLPHSHEAL